ncbi:hypothetical protein HUG10_14205 [Halorarum halophilum]|uniref:Uncharacterized protein n=1 Tax=Halorarum halophilum TaxID=2743090 RepID=A0A7D5GMB2_9EURY|nr:hypothetical protein [Halobaculum halophilum]QLG28627.1 hypothetical protein HUG10_14205 [Halobaculum halophilum]
MVELDEDVLEELQHGGRSLLIEDVVSIIERNHLDDRPGVSRETLEAYADALEADPDQQFDMETFHEELDSRLTDSDTWVDDDRLYRVGDDRISSYPATWHDRLGGKTDVRTYVVFLQDEAPEFKEDVGRGGAGPGIPQDQLLDVVSVVGRIERQEARAVLQDLHDRGELVEDADQHPDAGVMLGDEDGESYRDTSIDG